MPFNDKTLVCRDCNRQFTFSTSEQEFYQQKGLLNEPRRCPECRSVRRQRNSEPAQTGRQVFDAVCSSCGAATQVPFEPRPDRPVYCGPCFSKQRIQRQASYV